MKGGGSLSDENRDGMLVCGAVVTQVSESDLRAIELCLRLGNVGKGRNAFVITIPGELLGLGIGFDGVVEQLNLRVGGAEIEVIEGELCLEAEAGCGEIRGCCLRLFAGSGYAAADAAPEVELVV